ncbi:hypothetical protein VNO77_04399 [Canavalia gladiata]|uniref:Uncharacterized protein n=1 Tax=Canavalia gladiata TaxID=3824 RepID=A0AAN9N237_CANGL
MTLLFAPCFGRMVTPMRLARPIYPIRKHLASSASKPRSFPCGSSLTPSGLMAPSQRFTCLRLTLRPPLLLALDLIARRNPSDLAGVVVIRSLNLQTMVHVEIGEARLSDPDRCLILGVTGQGAPTPLTSAVNRPIHARGSGIGSAASRPN